MKFVFCISCIAMLLLLSGTAVASEIATVHGIAYEWSTFEPLDNAIIEVNSTPAQSMVAKYGIYSFELPNGSYLITARYYQDDVLTYYGEENVTVTSDGTYVLDLLLLPSYSDSEAVNTGSVLSISAAEQENTTSKANNLFAGSLLIVIILLAVLVYQFHKKSGGPEKKVKVMQKEPSSSTSEPDIHTELPAPVTTVTSPVTPLTTESPDQEDMDDIVDDVDTTEPVSEMNTGNEQITQVIPESESFDSSAPKEETVPSGPVPADLQEILDILKSHDGRMTQKDMRQRLRYSEGKVSLMLLDLEKRGRIQKFKKGRGNVLFLVDEEE